MPNRLLIPTDLLIDIQEYLEGEVRAWRESGSKDMPSILKSFINDIDTEMAMGTCPQCNGPMAWSPAYDNKYCGSWEYMEGGCPPVPRSRE